MATPPPEPDPRAERERWTELWRIEPGDVIGIRGHSPPVVEVEDISLAGGRYERHQVHWRSGAEHGRTTMSHLALVDLIRVSPAGDPRRDVPARPAEDRPTRRSGDAVVETKGQPQMSMPFHVEPDGPPYEPAWLGGGQPGRRAYVVYDQSEGFQPAYALVRADDPDDAAAIAHESSGGRLDPESESLVVREVRLSPEVAEQAGRQPGGGVAAATHPAGVGSPAPATCRRCGLPIAQAPDGAWFVQGTGATADGLSLCPPDPDQDPVGEHEPAAGGGDGGEPAKPELETRDGWTPTKGEWARLGDDEFDGPESMSGLLESCQAMAQASEAMAEATAGFAGTLASALGLDEAAVAGVAGIGEAYTRVAAGWQAAEARIRERYQQVIDAVDAGLRLPRAGRFLDGDGGSLDGAAASHLSQTGVDTADKAGADGRTQATAEAAADRRHAQARVPSTAEYTFPEHFGEAAGRTVVGDVVKAGKTYADVRWRENGRIERIRFRDAHGVVFKQEARTGTEEAAVANERHLAGDGDASRPAGEATAVDDENEVGAELAEMREEEAGAKAPPEPGTEVLARTAHGWLAGRVARVSADGQDVYVHFPSSAFDAAETDCFPLSDIRRRDEPAEPGAPAAETARPAPVSGALSGQPLAVNGWDRHDPSLPVCYHEDGPIGTAVSGMGQDARIDVDGEPLGDLLGRLATDVVMGRRAAQQALDEFKAIRGRLPAGSAARGQLDRAIRDMDAPPAPAPELPEAAPAPLRELMADLNAVPLARRDPQERDALAAIADAFAAGETGGLRMVDAVRRLGNRRHESLGECGKFEIDRAVDKAVAALSTMPRAALYPPSPPEAAAGDTAAATTPMAPDSHDAPPVEHALCLLPDGHPDARHFTIRVRRRGRRGDGVFVWAVTWHGHTLNRRGEWEPEPSPSDRDDDYFDRCRLDLAAALRLARQALPGIVVNGRRVRDGKVVEDRRAR
jgi:hypothetical protein